MRRFTIVALSLALATNAFATNTLAQEEHRQLGAHVHGHGTLNIVLEGKRLVMGLLIPGMDIVGFGHEPSTSEQKRVMQKARQQIADGPSLFVLPKAAQCKQIRSKIEVPRHKHDEQKPGHSEFHVQYELECVKPENLTTIKFAFFKQFPRSRELSVAIITQKSQSLHGISRAKAVLGGFVK